MQARVVAPEWLDTLPVEDPRALRSRSDLVRVNFLMGTRGVLKRELRALPHIATVAEIGAGSGTWLADAIEAAPARWEGRRVTLVDRQPTISEATLRRYATAGCMAEAVTADVFTWLAHTSAPTYDLIVANLFLHHFDRPALQALLVAIAAKTRHFVACEPRRSRFALGGAALLGLVGCNDVTRHDARVSVRAGFRDRELTALWPEGRWRVEESASGAFGHRFAAHRRPA